MARKKSALKKAKQTEVKTLRNKSAKSRVMNLQKKFKSAIQANDVEGAEKILPELFSEIDTACANGIFHANNGDRKKADAAMLLRDLKSGKLVITVKTDARTKANEKRAREAEQKAAVKKQNEENKAKRLAEKEAVLKANEKAKKAEKTKEAKEPKEVKEPKEPKAKKEKKAEATEAKEEEVKE